MTADSIRNDASAARISRIETQWSLLQRAHESDDGESARIARSLVVQRYIAPMYRYLNRVMGDPDAAEDVAHEVVLRLMQGRMAGATPSRGRFRDYLRTVLINAARARHKRDRAEVSLNGVVTVDPPEPDQDAFEQCVRDEVMQAAWRDLEECEQRTGQPFATLLRWRTTVARTTSEALQQQLLVATGRDYSAASARKLLQRARDQYAHLLVERVRQLLPPEQRDAAAVEEELLALGLHTTCRSVLSHQRSSD